MTIKNIKGHETEFGAQLFHRGIMGARVVNTQETAR